MAAPDRLMSYYNGFIEYSSSAFDADRPMDTLLSRTIANNAAHYADTNGQVLVAYTSLGSSGLTPKPWDRGNTITTAIYYPIATFGPFILRAGPDGLPYNIRARVAGSMNNVTGEGQIRVGVSGLNDVENTMTEAGSNVITTATLTTTTIQWTDSGLLTFSADQSQLMSTQVPTYNTVSGASPSQADAFVAVATVWSQRLSGSGGVTADLYGLYLAEYI